MRRLLAIVGLLGIFLTPIPEAPFGGRVRAGQMGFASCLVWNAASGT
jgi:hypothetical protein